MLQTLDITFPRLVSLLSIPMTFSAPDSLSVYKTSIELLSLQSTYISMMTCGHQRSNSDSHFNATGFFIHEFYEIVE